jgi:hypothetical protein
LARYEVAPSAKGDIAHDLNAASNSVSLEGQIESQNTTAVRQDKNGCFGPSNTILAPLWICALKDG